MFSLRIRDPIPWISKYFSDPKSCQSCTHCNDDGQEKDRIYGEFSSGDNSHAKSLGFSSTIFQLYMCPMRVDCFLSQAEALLSGILPVEASPDRCWRSLIWLCIAFGMSAQHLQRWTYFGRKRKRFMHVTDHTHI